jgi:formate dehydrogenase major subunit
MREMKRKGGKIIVVSSILSETADFADLYIEMLPGSELLFLNTLINLVIEKKIHRTTPDGFKELKNLMQSYTPENLERITGIKKEKVYEVAEIFEKSKKIGIIHGMGLTQHTNAVEILHSLTNLAILLNAKMLTNRGEINVQGSSDMLTLPIPLQFNEDVNQENLKKIWGEELPAEKGMNIIEAIGFGNAKVAIITNFNPAQSMPDLNKIHRNLKNMYLVQFDSYFNLTSHFARLILPSPLVIEREGSITTGERRVRLVKKVRNPIGEALEEWKVFCKLAKMFDATGFEYKNPFEIFDEATKIVKAYNGIDAKKVFVGEDCFADKKVRFYKLNPERFKGFEDMRSKDYPFLLFTFRSRFHFLTNEATSKSQTLNKIKEEGPFFYLNEEDAKSLGIKNFDEIIVKSSIASIKGHALISKKILKNCIGANFHFEELLINKLFPLEFDPKAFTPNFKCIAVKIIKKKA